MVCALGQMKTHKSKLHIGMHTAACLAAALLLFTGCATTSVPSAPPVKYPSTAVDWNGVDRVEFVKEFALASYRHLQVVPADTSSAELPPEDDNSYAPTITVLAGADQLLRYRIDRELLGRLKVSPDEAEGALKLVCRITEINPGSRAARYWVGFGAGSAWVRIEGDLIDTASGETLLRFDQRRIAATGAFGGNYEKMLNSCIEGIGDDIGRILDAH